MYNKWINKERANGNIPIDPFMFEQVIEILEAYFCKLDKDIREGNVNEGILSDYILVMSEGMELFSEKERWIDNIFLLVNRIKNSFEQKGIPQTVGLFGGGTSDFGYNLNVMSLATETFKKFTNTYNDIAYEVIDGFCDFVLTKIHTIKESYYDVISGLAGSMIYLAKCPEDKKRNITIIKVGNCLETIITGFHPFGNAAIENWFIKNDNIYDEELRKRFPRGLYNFSVSHGLIGPVFALAKASDITMPKHESLKVVKQALETYREFSCRNEDGVTFWPGQLDFNSYTAKRTDGSNKRQSWCYGSIGITGALYTISKYINDKSLQEFAFLNSERIAGCSIDEYELESPIICHGYAGMLLILVKIYRDKKSELIYLQIIRVLQKMIELYNPGLGYGFRDVRWDMKKNKVQKSLVDDNSFLEGSLGIIIALLSLVKYDIYAWDRLLLN
ncbi:lanthionine synthetase LanC family protein [Lactonifactor longoviformis]|uniref:lanthionine synthetase LanC family protein n=1 Tax=Lactonifactor longoviformis TaxID=341220 RepID=UPI0036F1D3AE